MRKQRLLDAYTGQAQTCWFATALIVLRVTIGILFLLAGVSKLSGWSAESYLLSASGPFANIFISLAGLPVIDVLNIVGLIAIGLAMILGLCVRPASFFGFILMLLYYFAHFEQNTVHGLIDYHIMYMIIFVLFMAGGAGHVFGLDQFAFQSLKRYPMLRSIFFA